MHNFLRNQFLVSGALSKLQFFLMAILFESICRGLFIIDHRGIIRQITLNDLPVGRSVDETLRLVQAFQYTDKFGEVCPAGWKPGEDTVIICKLLVSWVQGTITVHLLFLINAIFLFQIKPDLIKKNEFFSKH